MALLRNINGRITIFKAKLTARLFVFFLFKLVASK